KCPGCNAFGTLVEERAEPPRGGAKRRPLLRLVDVEVEEAARIATGVPELDRVLGGGLVPASLLPVGGGPGGGKSTLLLPGAAPGSVAQVRESAGRLLRVAKEFGVATILVGHVTKDGSVAGPRVLEHLVDCVLQFEGDRYHAHRILRAAKNRFGSTNELGVFEMTGTGLVGVPDPSALFGKTEEGEVGAAVACALEGPRPILLEIQALVAPTDLAM